MYTFGAVSGKVTFLATVEASSGSLVPVAESIASVLEPPTSASEATLSVSVASGEFNLKFFFVQLLAIHTELVKVGKGNEDSVTAIIRRSESTLRWPSGLLTRSQTR